MARHGLRRPLPRSSSRRPTCWPARGGSGSTRPPCSGQSKTAFQAEIDSACELIDFWRFNVHYAQQILADQPIANSPGIWNRTDHRPLEGFVYAITPFNFTAIAGNLPTAPALMGNTVIWKPSPTQQLAASLTMQLLEEAGMPPGVINMLPGDGLEVSKVALAHPDLAGIHFTGSTPTFQHLWRDGRREHHVVPLLPADRRRDRRQGLHRRPPVGRPRRAAGRDDPRRVRVPGPEVLGRQPRVRRRSSVWKKMRDSFLAEVDSIAMGDPTDFSNFMGAVIDDRAFAKHKAAITRAKRTNKLQVVAGGQVDDSRRLLRAPDRGRGRRPDRPDVHDRVLRPDPGRARLRGRPDFEKVVAQMESIAPYALTGAIIAQDRRAIAWAQQGAAVRRRQLLHQRQAHRRGRRAAAVRRRPRLAAPTTRPAPRSTCCAGPARAASRRRSPRRRTTATRTWADVNADPSQIGDGSAHNGTR